MGCLVVPAASAATIKVLTKIKGKKVEDSHNNESLFIPKIKWLNKMLVGGSALLLVEHVINGEIVPWFPFFTAASNKNDFKEMLFEMSTIGVAMTLSVVLGWATLVIVSKKLEKSKVCQY